MSAISSMHSMVIRVESMSIATSLKSASVRPASMKVASSRAAWAAASMAGFSAGVKVDAVAAQRVRVMGTWCCAGGQRGDALQHGCAIVQAQIPDSGPLEYQFLGHGSLASESIV
jgi:hypothetical protein